MKRKEVVRLKVPKEPKRFTVVINAEAQERLAELAKHFKLSQGQVLEVLIDQVDLATLAHAFKARREEKVQTRATRRALRNTLETLTPAQRELLEQFATEKA
jgi:hypothetical protein